MHIHWDTAIPTIEVRAQNGWTGHDSASMLLHYAEVIREEDVYAEFRKES